MAKIIRHNGQFAHYAPGIIYDIGITDPATNTRTPFYVGETSDPESRLKAHARAGKTADDESTLVYQTIRALDEAGVAWTMETLAEFGEEGPTDLEDEWIMKHLYDGYKLKNMKKGNANWMAEREACRDDMRQRSISSFRKYKEVLSIEEKQAEADRKHAEWMHQEQERSEREQSHARAELVRKELEAQMAKERAEQIEKNRLHEERVAKIKAQASAKWEAERPAREARLKAEAEAFQAREEERLREHNEWQQEQHRRAKQTRDEFQAQADIDQAAWPKEDRLHLQRLDNMEWSVISQWPKAIQEQQREMDKKYHAHTLSFIKNS